MDKELIKAFLYGTSIEELHQFLPDIVIKIIGKFLKKFNYPLISKEIINNG